MNKELKRNILKNSKESKKRSFSKQTNLLIFYSYLFTFFQEKLAKEKKKATKKPPPQKKGGKTAEEEEAEAAAALKAQERKLDLSFLDS